ncbi:FAD/NAD-P-binding domain-containing protein [Hysterangium stoloniferum]|nr:FAD/NAD-P-binding domain-containing protein [Hysterangium stoloniferum]
MDVLNDPIGIIGSGAAGLITAHTLLQDGFTNVQIITRDKTPGGVWARERVYSSLLINNIHGEYRFSALPMPRPLNADNSGGRLSGQDLCEYMETFADKFLKGRFRFQTEVEDVKREGASNWVITARNKETGVRELLRFRRIVMCTGGCSSPFIPPQLSPAFALQKGFRGPVIHSTQFGAETGHILSKTDGKYASEAKDGSGSIVVVGGGKSALDISSYLSNEGRRVTIVLESSDAVLAVTTPLPDFIRKSRFLAILSPHIELRSRLERFLHMTWLGSKIVHGIWNAMARTSFDALKLPKDSPLRKTHSLFWGVRTNDEGVVRPKGFYALVNAGKINVEAPARVERFGDDGRSVILNNGKRLEACAVILATGYTSSWKDIIDEKTSDEIGLGRRLRSQGTVSEWNYHSLQNPPCSQRGGEQWASSIYRGIVPAKNIDQRDFAINGGVFTTNPGYFCEVTAHWISSYFLNDPMRLPRTPEEACEYAERNSVWLHKRFPGELLGTNESYSSNLTLWNWPQTVDELLDDMKVPSLRSGGNWFTWAFKTIDLNEITNLKEERSERRVLRI